MHAKPRDTENEAIEHEDAESLLTLCRLLNQAPRDGVSYYCITLTANAVGECSLSVQTSWVGFTKDTPEREIRQGCLYDGEHMRTYLGSQVHQPALLVNDEDDLDFWLTFGGHGLIAEDVARRRLSSWIAPSEVGRVAAHRGFTSTQEGLVRRSPTRKLRMKVLNRDGRRCAICGRNAASSVDVELHVHHVVPWKEGGITDERNLVTLCGACHGGLDPHYDRDLESMVMERYRGTDPGYHEGIAHYQRALASLVMSDLV